MNSRPPLVQKRQDSTLSRERARDGGRGDNGTKAGQGETSNNLNQTDKEDTEDRIGPYLIGEEVGRGSFATVFKGARFDTGTLVAVKSVIRSKLTSKLLENLESEISILKRITHRNIVELKDCLKTDTHIYLIMAFCSAGDLSIYIRKRGDLAALTASNQGLLPEVKVEAIGKIVYPHPKEGGLNETIVRHFLGQLVDALKFLRAQNVIHRDIKPQNLLLQPAEVADLVAGHPPGIPVLKVADFGFARWLPSQSMAETLCGSPLYMAPEILRYEKYDAKADLWSVGAVLFEMSVGKPPFRAQNHVDLLRKIERGEDRIKFPDEKRLEEGVERPNKVADDLKGLIRRLLKRTPVERMGFEDFFTESRNVAEGGSASGLVSAEGISIRYSKPTPSAIIPTNSTIPASPQIESEAAFLSTSSRPVLPSPIPTARNIYAEGTEPPAFARKKSEDVPLSSSPAGVKRTPSFPANYIVARNSPISTETETLSGGGRGFLVTQNIPSKTTLAPPIKASDSFTDDDSVLGRDYVVVEKRTVEINALADELANAPNRDNIVARRPSRGFLSRPLSSLGVPTSSTISTPYPPPSPSYDSTPPLPFAIPVSRPIPPSHPYSISSPRPLSFLSSSPRSGSSPIERFPGSPLALVGSPTTAIAKALNLASLKIFGSPTDGILLRRFSARKPIKRTSTQADPAEDKILSELEEIAQKSSVIFDFADSKILQILPPTPQTSSSNSLGTPSYFNHIASKAENPSSSNPFSPVPTTAPSATSMRRNSSSSSDPRGFVMASSAKAEILAAEALVLYLKGLGFLSRGIEKARKFWGERQGNSLGASADFNEAVQWFRQRFNESFDKAEFAKSRSMEEIPESVGLAEKLMFDRALEISRAAAVNELRGENPIDCETAYETALWILYAILDEGNDVSTPGTTGEEEEDEDRATLHKFINSISLRLAALRKKLRPEPDR